MDEFILVLTLALGSGNAGYGGVTTATFSSEEACYKAGAAWVDKVQERYDSAWIGPKDRGSFFMCFPKGDTDE